MCCWDVKHYVVNSAADVAFAIGSHKGAGRWFRRCNWL